MLSLYQFYVDAETRAKNTGERLGQAMFNHLYDVRPDLSAKIQGTDKDPFYVERPGDECWRGRWALFVSFIERSWYK